MAGSGWTHGRAEVAGALLSRRCRAPPFFGGRGNPRCTVSLDPSPVRERDQGGAQVLVPDRAAEGSDVPPASGLALHSLRKNDRCQPRALVIGEGLSREPPHESLGDIARAEAPRCGFEIGDTSLDPTVIPLSDEVREFPDGLEQFAARRQVPLAGDVVFVCPKRVIRPALLPQAAHPLSGRGDRVRPSA